MVHVHADEYDLFVDAIEDRCPMPLLKTKMALAKAEVGMRICVVASDSGSMKDIPKYIDISSSTLEQADQVDGVCTFVIKKG